MNGSTGSAFMRFPMAWLRVCSPPWDRTEQVSLVGRVLATGVLPTVGSDKTGEFGWACVGYGCAPHRGIGQNR